MMTGDNPLTSNAKEIGIDRVIAGVLPEGKSSGNQTTTGEKTARSDDLR